MNVMVVMVAVIVVVMVVVVAVVVGIVAATVFSPRSAPMLAIAMLPESKSE